MCKGAEAKFFNGHTNVTSSRFIVFGVKGLLQANRSVRGAMLFNILSFMSDRLLTIGNTTAVLDELYVWLSDITQIKSGLAKEIFRQELTELYQKQTQRRNELNVDAQTVLNEVINQMQSGTVQNKHIEELLQYLADRLRFLSGKKQYGYLKADLKAVVDEVVDELAKDPRVAAAYNLWYELREDVLRTYKDNLPERLPLSGQKEFKRIKNLVILEAVKLEQYQQVFHPDDLWDGNPDEHAEEAQLFVYEQMNQSMSHPPEAAEAGQARTQYALGKIYRDGQGVEKDVRKAVELFTLAAMQGNSFAAFALGKMYLSDDPALSRNVAAALKWITNAAEHGNQFAQYHLGKLLLKGTNDISQDTNSALRWLLASVEQGNVHAEYALAMAYLKGESVPKDSLKAMELLKRASSREHQFAQYQLGKLLLQGEDVPKDVVAAVHWLTASAMHGNQYAQYALGKLYLLGKGVEKDKDRAAKWFQMAANQGNEYAQYYLKHMDDPKLIEMTHLNETLYCCGIACSAEGHATASGNYIIDLLLANVCKQNVTRFPYEIARLAEDIAGGVVVTAPAEADLKDPKLGPYVEKYFKAAPGVSVENRFRILRLIENLTLGTAAVGYRTESLHGAGSPQAQRIMIARQGNLPMKKELAKKIAHVKE